MANIYFFRNSLIAISILGVLFACGSEDKSGFDPKVDLQVDGDRVPDMKERYGENEDFNIELFRSDLETLSAVRVSSGSASAVPTANAMNDTPCEPRVAIP